MNKCCLAVVAASLVLPAPAVAQDGEAMDPGAVVNPTATIGPRVEPARTGDGSDFKPGRTEAPADGQEATTGDDTGTESDTGTGTETGTGPETDPGTGTRTGAGTATPTADPNAVRTDPRRAEAIRDDPGYSNAFNQTPEEKRREAKADCVSTRPPISPMLGVQSRTSGDRGGGWIVPALVVAAVALTIAAGAYYLRRRRAAAQGRREPKGPLETVATIVGIFGTLVGVAGALGARLGADAPPAPEAVMIVREVHPRVTRGEYAAKTNARVKLSQEDRREVGNVVWLELQLTGYQGARPVVEWGLYDRDAGETLLPTTAKRASLKVEDADVQTIFLPIWIGYPQSARFQAQFRLLERNSVRQMAATGQMRGTNYRYACKRDVEKTN
jgi:hypothetical protein